MDGNKRTAFAAAYTLLTINGTRVTATANEVYTFIRSLDDANDFTLERLAKWLRAEVG